MSKIKVGITGQNGFIGSHVLNTINLYPSEFELVHFDRKYFNKPNDLDAFVISCNVIVHLAALNRHEDLDVLYTTNKDLVNTLIESLERTESQCHLIYSSSTQEDNDNAYGKSKKEGRHLFSDWANRSGGIFTGIVVPNVFGPFGLPNYNSFIATFCHQLTRGEQPTIKVDSYVKLIYVSDLARIIVDQIRSKQDNHMLNIVPKEELKVSNILATLERFKLEYLEKSIIPSLSTKFESDLFNTFRSYIDVKAHYPVKFLQHTDDRGAFVEVIRLNVGGQVSFSTTRPGVTRGNHFHTRKIERFAVIKGSATIQLRKIGTTDVLNYHLSGDEPAYVDMPIWYTHNIINTGKEELYTIFWINEFFDPEDPDTYFENV